MQLARHWKKIMVAAFAVAAFVVSAHSQAATVNVGYTVSQSIISCGANCNPTDSITITSVTTSTAATTAQISWHVTASSAITAVNFAYGVSGYTNPITVTNLGNGSYSVNLSGLANATSYQYQITASDSGGSNTSYSGVFVTQSAPNAALAISGVTVTTTVTQATIGWNTNRAASGQVVYGLTGTYTSSTSDINLTTSHTLVLANLSPNTLYHYSIIATDNVGNSTSTSDGTFSTTRNSVAPSDVSNLQAATSTGNVILSWTNPTDLDFAGVRIVRKTGSAPQTVNDGTVLATTTGQTYADATAAPNVRYYYTVFSFNSSGIYSGGATVSAVITSTVLPLADVTNLQAVTSTGSIVLTWVNPTDPSFAGVRIVRKVGSVPQSINDGTVMATTTGQTFTDPNAVLDTQYYYAVFVFNGSLYSPGVSVFAMLTTSPTSFAISNVAVTTTTVSASITWDTNNAASSRVDYGTSASYGLQGTGTSGVLHHQVTLSGLTPGATYHYQLTSIDAANHTAVTSDATFTTKASSSAAEICGNGIDDDGNGLTDCADPACSSNPTFCPVGRQEICNNGIDDDNNGLTDCADPICKTDPVCIIISKSEICNNGVDDDGNGYIDCADAACSAFAGCARTTTSTYTPPPTTVGTSYKLSLNDVVFFVGNHKIKIAPSADGVVSGLATTHLSIVMPANIFSSPLDSLALTIDGTDKHQFALQGTNYVAEVSFPAVGGHVGYIEASYANGQFDSVKVGFKSLAFGTILDNGKQVAGAKVTLYSSDDTEMVMSDYGFANPILSTGLYGWAVPNGSYYLTVERGGYYKRTTPVFIITNNVINQDITLVVQPPPLTKDLTPANVVANVKAAAALSTQLVQDIKANPQVQDTASQVVVPVVVSVAAVGTVSLISWANLLSLLRFLFLQPILLAGRRRRRGWGQVYNTLSKMPIDLATVRLISQETGRVLQSKVTDKQGRYAFIVSPGKYRLEVVKAGFSFPSTLLQNFKVDGSRPDIYHGEEVLVTDKNAVITANIPLDPVGEHKKPVRIIWQRVWRSTQVGLSWLGLLVTLASLYISPRWYVWALAIVHVLFFVLFRRLALPPKIKSWGIVYDASSKKPIDRAVARLFNRQFNKLVSTQITDAWGRYYFLAGDDQYYVTYEHPAYEASKVDDINVQGKTSTIAVDIGLKKSIVEPPAPPAAEPPAASVTPPPASSLDKELPKEESTPTV